MAHVIKRLKRITIVILSSIALIGIIVTLYMQLPLFGKVPSGERLERIKQSPNYRDGKFQNLNFTPSIAEGYTIVGETYKTFFDKTQRKRPTAIIPTIKTDLSTIPPDSNVLVWFGHSSYLIQIDGKRFLIDPVLSGSASPLPFGVKSFEGTDIYAPDDMPQIDFLLISHDHYDHLDYKTIVALKPKVKNVICGLGVGEHFEYWEYEPSVIIEKDWYETVSIDESVKIHILPARHGSGRSIARDNTLWVSFIIETPLEKIYLGGDSGYDTHFAEIGAKYGSIDLAILENGQYNDAWHYIHTLPDEVLQAAKDLNAKRIFPVHSSKFFMARHSWDEPLVKLSELCEEADFPLITPMIGEAVFLNDSTRIFRKWWLGLN